MGILAPTIGLSFPFPTIGTQWDLIDPIAHLARAAALPVQCLCIDSPCSSIGHTGAAEKGRLGATNEASKVQKESEI